MFAEHQPLISVSARRSPEGFKRVCQFVLATIRVRLPEACAATRKLASSGEREPLAYFGSKLDGLDYLDAHAEQLWSHCEHLAATLNGRELENALVDVLMDIPGIGFAKAGFIAQLAYGVSGCIDTHNLVRFGMRMREFRSASGMSTRNRRRQVERYNETVAQCGGTAALWDAWCAYVSARQGYGTADEISAMHLCVIDRPVAVPRQAPQQAQQRIAA